MTSYFKLLYSVFNLITPISDGFHQLASVIYDRSIPYVFYKEDAVSRMTSHMMEVHESHVDCSTSTVYYCWYYCAVALAYYKNITRLGVSITSYWARVLSVPRPGIINALLQRNRRYMGGSTRQQCNVWQQAVARLQPEYANGWMQWDGDASADWSAHVPSLLTGSACTERFFLSHTKCFCLATITWWWYCEPFNTLHKQSVPSAVLRWRMNLELNERMKIAKHDVSNHKQKTEPERG